MKYVIPTRVKLVEEVYRVVRADKRGDDVVVVRENLGWSVLFEGSHERLFLGYEKPDLQAGDPVRITIEKSTL